MVEKTWKKKEFAPLVVKFEICCVSILYFFEVDSWVGLVTVFLGLPCNKEVELRIGSDFCFYCSSQAPIPESKISRTFGPRERCARIWTFVLHQVNSMSGPPVKIICPVLYHIRHRAMVRQTGIYSKMRESTI